MKKEFECVLRRENVKGSHPMLFLVTGYGELPAAIKTILIDFCKLKPDEKFKLIIERDDKK